jgi:FkbM family methyltransferase
MKELFYGEGADEYIRKVYFPDYAYTGTVIEVGGGTPEFLSMSRHFKINGWRAIIVEPNPAFAAQHRTFGNEVYEYAASDTEEDDFDFTIFNQLVNTPSNQHKITDHSWSSLGLKLKENYEKLGNYHAQSVPKQVIKVKVRKLDTIIEEAKVSKVDILTVDVEGWELEVMRGLTNIMPTIVVLENISFDPSYEQYMEKNGYEKVHNLHINYIFKRKY